MEYHRSYTLGEDKEAGKQWAGAVLHTAKQEGYEPFWEQLLELRKDCCSRARQKAVDRLLSYVSDRRKVIRYEGFLAHGRQIGSGPMESQCRAVPGRVKGPGKRWDADDAEVLMVLEAMPQDRQGATIRQGAPN